MPISNEHLFKKHYNALCYFAHGYLKSTEEAKDVVQTAFLSYLNTDAASILDEKHALNLLYKIVKNNCLNKIRHRQIAFKYEQSLQETDFIDEDATLAIMKAEVMRMISEKIALLPSACRQIISMAYMEGLSNQEISEILNISANTVKTQKRRGLEFLRLVFKSRGIWVVLFNFLFF